MEFIGVKKLYAIFKDNFIAFLSISIVVGVITYFFTSHIQTYTCTLNFEYAYPQAEEGLALDGKSKLDPFEIQNPAVIQKALKDLGLSGQDGLSVEEIRNNITITEMVDDLDKSVSDSAALLGEKYSVNPVQYKMKYTYSHKLGDEFGAKMFDRMITEYDEYLITKYYNKVEIADFGKILNQESSDYLDIANAVSTNLESITDKLDSMAEAHPDFRSRRTGYTFADLSLLYKRLQDVQYAKYYGNIRAANLSKDPEMVIKNYTAKIIDLQKSLYENTSMSENYKQEIGSFYDSYKRTGLYNQAGAAQRDLRDSNNRDQDVLREYDVKKITNTYDGIVLSYVEKAEEVSKEQRTIEEYEGIISSFSADAVDEGTKEAYKKKNEKILDEIIVLSADYSARATETLEEFYNDKINDDLKYLIVSEMAPDKPVKTLTVFAALLCMCMLFAAEIIMEAAKPAAAEGEESEEETEE